MLYHCCQHFQIFPSKFFSAKRFFLSASQRSSEILVNSREHWVIYQCPGSFFFLRGIKSGFIFVFFVYIVFIPLTVLSCTNELLFNFLRKLLSSVLDVWKCFDHFSRWMSTVGFSLGSDEFLYFLLWCLKKLQLQPWTEFSYGQKLVSVCTVK